MQNYTNFYPEAKIEKIIKEIKEKKLTIAVLKSETSSKNVGNEIDRIAYSCGYVDYSKESIIFKGKCEKKIVIWEELLKCDNDMLEKALAYLLEIYFNIDEEKILQNYKELSNAIKLNPNFEYTVLTNVTNENLSNIGGFRKSILDKLYYYLDYASADYISSCVTKHSYILPKRTKFLKTILKANGYTLKNLVENKRKNSVEFIEHMIPKEYLMKISLYSTIIENTDNRTRYLLYKFKLENEIYRYLSFMYYEGRMQKFSNDEKEEIAQKLLSHSMTLYNPDIKLDCGLI